MEIDEELDFPSSEEGIGVGEDQSDINDDMQVREDEDNTPGSLVLEQARGTRNNREAATALINVGAVWSVAGISAGGAQGGWTGGSDVGAGKELTATVTKVK